MLTGLIVTCRVRRAIVPLWQDSTRHIMPLLRFPRLTFFLAGVAVSTACFWFLTQWMAIANGWLGLGITHATRPGLARRADVGRHGPSLAAVRHGAYLTLETGCRLQTIRPCARTGASLSAGHRMAVSVAASRRPLALAHVRLPTVEG